MQMQDWFFFWGTFFFFSWFIFLIVMTLIMFGLYKRTIKLQEQIEKKLSEPQTHNLIGLLNLLPPLFAGTKKLVSNFRR